MNRELARALCALLMAGPLVACGGGGGGEPLADPAATSEALNSSTALVTTNSAQPDECSTDQ